MDTVKIIPEGNRSRVLYDALTQDQLELIIFPTEQCNFRCTYCYEDFEKGRMSASVVSGIKALISHRAPTLKRLHLSWFGGEPLIAYDIIREISQHAQSVALDHGFVLSGAVTSNAYKLTRDRAKELASFGVQSIQVSLDGDKEAHDQTRVRVDGAGTFETLWQRLLDYQEEYFKSGLQMKILIRLHIHPDNQEAMLRLAKRISVELRPEPFSVLVRAVGHWGGKRDVEFDVYGRRSSTFEEAQAAIYRSLPAFQSGDGSDEHEKEIYVCYAAKGNSFTIRSDGSVGKCTVALKDPANNIGQLGEDGRLDLSGEKFGAWLHGLSSLNPDDLGCPAMKLPRKARVAVERAEVAIVS